MKSESNPKNFLESNAYLQAKEKLQTEIQHPQVRIDRSCWIKTKDEVKLLKEVKKAWKKNQK